MPPSPVHASRERSGALEFFSVAFPYCLLAGEGLPAANSNVHKARLEFDTEANAVCRLRGYQRGSATEEGFIDELARVAVIEDRPAHAFDGLLRRMLCIGILSAGRDGPQRGLPAVAAPVAFLPNGVPARLMLPMVIALTHHQTFLSP